MFLIFFVFHLIKFCSSPEKYRRHPEASNYCILFGGYKEKPKWAKGYEFMFVFVHFLIGMVIGLLYKWPVVQIGLILGLCVLLLLYTLALRPHKFTIVLIFEIITQIILIIALIGLLLSMTAEKEGCYNCYNREGTLCYLILAMLFLFLALLALGLLLFSFLAGCCGHKLFYKKKDIPEEIEVSGGQNLSGLAGIDQVKNNNFQTNSHMAMGTMGAMGALGTMGAGYKQIKNSNQNYSDERYVTNIQEETVKKHVVIDEDKNESYEDISHHMTNEEDRELSQTEEVIIGKNDTLMEDSDDEREMHRRREKKTIYEFNQEVRSDMDRFDGRYKTGAHFANRQGLDNSLLDRTMTVKVDTDDERIRQNKVLHALSVSDINNQNIEDNENQINQAKRVIEINKRSEMVSNRMMNNYESDTDNFDRRMEREAREFHLNYDQDGQSERQMNFPRFERDSDVNTDREFLSETNVVKTRVNSQAVGGNYGSTMGQGQTYYMTEEHDAKSYRRDN